MSVNSEHKFPDVRVTKSHHILGSENDKQQDLFEVKTNFDIWCLQFILSFLV